MLHLETSHQSSQQSKAVCSGVVRIFKQETYKRWWERVSLQSLILQEDRKNSVLHLL